VSSIVIDNIVGVSGWRVTVYGAIGKLQWHSLW